MSDTKPASKSPLDLMVQHSFVVQTIVFYLSLCLQFIKSFLRLEMKATQLELFPSNCNIQKVELKDVKPCATLLGTRLVPVRNASGEIEWKFVEESSQHQASQNTNFNIPSTEFFDEQLAKMQSQNKATTSQVFSPVSETSIDSNIDGSKLQQHQQAKATKRVQLASPASSTFSPPSPGKQQVVDLSPHSSHKSNSSIENDEEMEEEDEEDEEDENGIKIGKKHACPYCPASFRIRGYLTRHMKKHSSEKLYRCPFYNLKSSHKCHATGGFSRRDTYKTHLKSRHFKYPSGTKSANRTGMIGWCGLCGQSFANNEIWVETHVESGECSGLPQNYQKRDSSKKKTGKRSHLLDAVSTLTPPPLDLKKSPSTTSSCSSPTSTSDSLQHNHINYIKLEDQTSKYNSPISSIYSPSPSLIATKPKTIVKDQSLDAFYYKPTQYKTISYNNPSSSMIVIDREDDFVPMDDAFYSIKEPHYNKVFDACRNQFPDYGI